MSELESVVQWMLEELARDHCLYQDDVVDYLVKSKQEGLLRENAQGSLVVGIKLLKAFRAATEQDVVWVKPDFYWRYRVSEDEPGREARG